MKYLEIASEEVIMKSTEVKHTHTHTHKHTKKTLVLEEETVFSNKRMDITAFKVPFI